MANVVTARSTSCCIIGASYPGLRGAVRGHIDIWVNATRKHAIGGVVRMESGGRGFFVVCARAIVWLRARYDGPWRLPRARMSPPGCAHLSTIRAWQPRQPSTAQHNSTSISLLTNAVQSSDVYSVLPHNPGQTNRPVTIPPSSLLTLSPHPNRRLCTQNDCIRLQLAGRHTRLLSRM